MREDRFIGQDTVVDKYHAPNADYDMTTRDYVLRPSADQFSGPIVISLPPVSEARGRFYSIVCRNADAVNFITIQDLDDSECWEGDIKQDGKCDAQLFYSDGMKWHVMRSIKSPGDITSEAPGTVVTTLAPTTSAQPTTAAPTTLLTSLAPTTGV